MNEADTRAELIEPQLQQVGWKTGGDVRVNREVICPGEILSSGDRDEEKELKPDFVLTYKNRKIAAIEAKSDEKEVTEGVAQAIKYAKRLDLKYTYAANGKEIYEINMETSKQGLVDSFPSPEELWNKTYNDLNEWELNFDAVPFEDFGGTKQPRYYQELAVNKAVRAIANNQQRILLNLATGTGKTFIAFQIAWKLFQTRWNKERDGKRLPRILFLADRNNLADQAMGDFRAFKGDSLKRILPKEISKNGTVPKNNSIFFTIFQTFMSGEDEPYFGQYEKDFFDFIIIDECHRGGANDEGNWRGILEYFNSAVQLGLTATPKRELNADTYDYFGEPVYKYSLIEGIADGFLTPFRVERMKSSMDTYTYSKDDDVEVIDGDPEEGREYQEHEFNRTITIPEREEDRVKRLLDNINTNDKTLIFCADQIHALRVRDMVNQHSTSNDPEYCVRVGADDGEDGDTYLLRFRDNEEIIPTILTSSLKLTTGVDATNVRNIVLMRPVSNMIEFKQILGRGSRLHEGKNYYTLYDFVGAFELFHDPEWEGEPKKPSGGGGNRPPGISPGGGQEEEEKVEIRLSDGKVRNIVSSKATHFVINGKLISAAEFMQNLFNVLKLPEVLEDENKLSEIWSKPETRKELLKKLERHNFKKNDLEDLRTLINAENSDMFDVLQWIAFHKPFISRQERVEQSKGKIYAFLKKNEIEFIDSVLNNYIQSDIDELDDSNLSEILRAKYGNISKAQEELGSIERIQEIFFQSQKELFS
ncbi:DEAD/DEAH box helicase family protein [SAR86 cluster bacterium]|nr:DEAD/DEAH box helicase family protein [SAR86 cluster bacterium]